jgi:hypothetical protein
MIQLDQMRQLTCQNTNSFPFEKPLKEIIHDAINKYVLWSKINDKPIFVNIQDIDIKLCCWDGIVLTSSYAVLLIMHNIIGSELGSSMLNHSHEEYKELVDFVELNNSDYLKYKLLSPTKFYVEYIQQKFRLNFFEDISQKYTPVEVLSWLLSNNRYDIKLIDD